MVIQGVTYPSDFEAKKLMIEMGRRMDAKSFSIAGDGSISVRVGPNAVWVTEQGADKSTLSQDQFVRVDLSGKQMMSAHPRRLPADLPIHLAVYGENTALRCIVHAYPVGAAALGARGMGAEPAAWSPAVRALGRIQLLPEAAPDAQARAVALLCKAENGVVLCQDGCMMWGETPLQAFHRVETLDYYVKVLRSTCASAPAPAAPAPVCAAPACPAPEQPAPALPAIEGLTPLILPGKADGFRLPTGSAPAPAAPAPVAAPQPVAAPAPETLPATQKPREQVMAEVIRRALAAMK